MESNFERNYYRLVNYLEATAEYRRRRSYEAGEEGGGDFAASRVCQTLITSFRSGQVSSDLLAEWGDWQNRTDPLAATEALSVEAWALGVSSTPADANAFLTSVLAHKG